MDYEVNIMKCLLNEQCTGPENPMSTKRLLALLNQAGITDAEAIKESLGFLIGNGDIEVPANDNDSDIIEFWLK